MDASYCAAFPVADVRKMSAIYTGFIQMEAATLISVCNMFLSCLVMQIIVQMSRTLAEHCLKKV